MNEKNTNAIRSVLLAAIVVVVLLTIGLYFYNGRFNVGSIVVAALCLVVYLMTGKKKTGE